MLEETVNRRALVGQEAAAGAAAEVQREAVAGEALSARAELLALCHRASALRRALLSYSASTWTGAWEDRDAWLKGGESDAALGPKTWKEVEAARGARMGAEPDAAHSHMALSLAPPLQASKAPLVTLPSGGAHGPACASDLPLQGPTCLTTCLTPPASPSPTSLTTSLTTCLTTCLNTSDLPHYEPRHL